MPLKDFKCFQFTFRKIVFFFIINQTNSSTNEMEQIRFMFLDNKQIKKAQRFNQKENFFKYKALNRVLHS